MPLPLLAVGGILSAASEGFSLLNNAIGNNQAKKMALFNDQLQRNMMRDAPSIQAAGLSNAGLSVASLNGGFSSSPSTGTGSAPGAPQAPDPAAALSAAMSLQTQEKQNKLLDQQIRKQKLDNDEQEDRQNAFRKGAASYWVDDDGHRVYTTDTDATSRADAYSKRHEGMPPELIVPSGHLSREAYNADSDVAAARNNYYGNLLQSEVSRMKLGDKDTMNALAHMDKQSYDNLVQTGKNLLKDWHVKDNQIRIGNVDITLKNLEKDLKEKDKLIKGVQYEILRQQYETDRDTNIRPIVQKLMSDGFDLSTIGKLVVAVLLKLTKV